MADPIDFPGDTAQGGSRVAMRLAGALAIFERYIVAAAGDGEVNRVFMYRTRQP